MQYSTGEISIKFRVTHLYNVIDGSLSMKSHIIGGSTTALLCSQDCHQSFVECGTFGQHKGRTVGWVVIVRGNFNKKKKKKAR